MRKIFCREGRVIKIKPAHIIGITALVVAVVISLIAGAGALVIIVRAIVFGGGFYALYLMAAFVVKRFLTVHNDDFESGGQVDIRLDDDLNVVSLVDEVPGDESLEDAFAAAEPTSPPSGSARYGKNKSAEMFLSEDPALLAKMVRENLMKDDE